MQGPWLRARTVGAVWKRWLLGASLVLERAELTRLCVGPGARQLDVEGPMQRGPLLAVSELGDPAVTFRAPWCVQLPGARPAVALQQSALLFAPLLLGALSVSSGNLLGVHGLPAATGGVGVVCWTTRALLRVFLLPPFGPSVLEPHLRATCR